MPYLITYSLTYQTYFWDTSIYHRPRVALTLVLLCHTYYINYTYHTHLMGISSRYAIRTILTMLTSLTVWDTRYKYTYSNARSSHVWSQLKIFLRATVLPRNHTYLTYHMGYSVQIDILQRKQFACLEPTENIH